MRKQWLKQNEIINCDWSAEQEEAIAKNILLWQAWTTHTQKRFVVKKYDAGCCSKGFQNCECRMKHIVIIEEQARSVSDWNYRHECLTSIYVVIPRPRKAWKRCSVQDGYNQPWLQLIRQREKKKLENFKSAINSMNQGILNTSGIPPMSENSSKIITLWKLIKEEAQGKLQQWKSIQHIIQKVTVDKNRTSAEDYRICRAYKQS